jgi:vacuolar protein sorting-associated protein 52
MEIMLQSFQDSLGEISKEIKTLQDQSNELNVKLTNRTKAEEYLSEFVKMVSISSNLVTDVTKNEANDKYLENLIGKIKATNQKN